MRRAALLVAALVTGCQTPSPPGPPALSAIDLAGRGRERAAYTAYAVALFDLQLQLLEILPAGWFPGTPECRAGVAEIAAITGIPSTGDDLAALERDARAWRAWYVERRPALSGAERVRLDPLFARLEGTTPFLLSEEFRDVVRSLASMSGLPASWEGPVGEECHATWNAFDHDRRAWRQWFETHRARLEWDVGGHRLVPGRGLER